MHINNINKTSVNIMIKELEQLLKECHPSNTIVKHRLEVDLKSYKAIRHLFDLADSS